MEFLRDIKKSMRLGAKLELAKRLGKTPQSYYSLEKATERISLRDLVALRHLQDMTDTRLLDPIEREVGIKNKSRRGSPPR